MDRTDPHHDLLRALFLPQGSLCQPTSGHCWLKTQVEKAAMVGFANE
jgi:hypothetical protein